MATELTCDNRVCHLKTKDKKTFYFLLENQFSKGHFFICVLSRLHWYDTRNDDTKIEFSTYVR